jgi:hypothetical protein
LATSPEAPAVSAPPRNLRRESESLDFFTQRN